jgi:hypothetical protein
MINENETYWRLRYYKEFALDEDWREEDWLIWYRDQMTPKQSTLTSQPPKTLRQKATYDWSHVNWRKAYYRRYMLYRHIINGYWCERYCDLQIDPESDSLHIVGMNAWATLIGEKNETRMWVVWHDITPLGLKSKQLAWNELPLTTNSIGKIISILSTWMVNHYIIIQCVIQLPVKSDEDDQISSEDIRERKAIIVWDAKDRSRMFPLYIQQSDEARDDEPLPEITWFYTGWVLGSTQLASDGQPDATSRRYFIYDLKRELHYSFGSVYTNSYAYIQAATEDYVQVIILYLDSADMMVRDESHAITDGKPFGLRVHWHSYAFDNEHSESLEDHSGEIIMPYCNNPMVYSERYGPGLSIIVIYDAEDPLAYVGGIMPHAMLALVRVPDHSLPQNGISHRRRSRRDGAIGEVIWTQPIATKLVQGSYSQNLIVVQGYIRIDILSGTDGKIVRQINYTTYVLLRPIIGPYFYLPGSNNGNFIINIETGEKFQHHIKLPPLEKRHIATSIEDMHDPSPTDRSTNSLFTLTSWPNCNCIGQLAIHESGHRNRFYLYCLSDF